MAEAMSVPTRVQLGSAPRTPARVRDVSVVLDDDPTGTQAVAGVRVLLRWSPETIHDNVAHGEPCVHLITNSLEALSAVVGVPLSLHGASGLSAEDLRRAISAGMVKVNANTELREAWFRTILADAPELAPGAPLLRLQAKIHDALTQVACSKLDGARSTRLTAVRPSAEESR